MERRYELALERIQELEEKYIDLKAEYELLKDELKHETQRGDKYLSILVETKTIYERLEK